MWIIPVLIVVIALFALPTIFIAFLSLLGWAIALGLGALAGTVTLFALMLMEVNFHASLIASSAVMGAVVAWIFWRFAVPKKQKGDMPPVGTREHYRWANRIGEYSDD